MSAYGGVASTKYPLLRACCGSNDRTNVHCRANEGGELISIHGNPATYAHGASLASLTLADL